MDWRLLLNYLKFFVGCGFGIFAYMTQIKYYELMILVAGLIVLSSNVDIKIGSNKQSRK